MDELEKLNILLPQIAVDVNISIHYIFDILSTWRHQ